MESRVWSILASRLVSLASSSAIRDSVVPGNDGSSKPGESIFSEGGEGTSGGVTKGCSLDEAERERSRKRGILVSWTERPVSVGLFCPAVRATVGREAGGRRKTSGLTRTADRRSKVQYIQH
jgi:hypothetical protein